jgi:hypothetical protein
MRAKRQEKGEFIRDCSSRINIDYADVAITAKMIVGATASL